MKITKRVIASLLVTLMALTSLLSVNVFAADEIVFPDVANDYAYKNAIYALVEKGIINGIEEEGVLKFKPDATITRAQFAKMLAIQMVGNESFLTETTDKFPDCTTHWANKFIAYAITTGFIEGYTDGTFRPDNPVKYGEVIKMLVCAKGYGKLYKEKTTPWYKGYIDIAKDMKLTDKALADGASEASRGLVAQLIYNMDYTKVLNTGSSSSSGSGGGFNLKEDEVEYEEDTGVVVAVFDSSLTNEDYGLNKYQIVIDDTTYKIREGTSIDNYYRYLGKGVDFEYDEDTNQLVRIEENGENDTFTLSAEDIFNVTSNTIEYYDEDEDEEEVALSSSLYVIYNGVGVPRKDITAQFIENYLNIECGEITLLNNDGGRDYDVAYVTSYETYYVTGRSVSKELYTFTDSNKEENKSITLKNDEDEVVVYKVTEANGKKINSTVSAIPTSKVVLSVAAPLSAGVTEVIVSSATLKSAEIDAMAGYEEIEINNKEYSASDYYMHLVDKDESTYGLKVGDKATFYLDYAGRIVFTTKSESNEPYGYVMAYGETGGFTSERALMIFDNTGIAREYPLKTRVKVNGTTVDNDKVEGILKENAAVINANKAENDTAECAQLVKFATGTENGVTVISELITIDPDDLEDGGIVPGEFSDGNTKVTCSAASGSTRTFKNDSGVQFIINSSTLVFLIPDDRMNDEAYKKRTYSNFYQGSSYILEAYDIDKTSKAAKAVLVYTGSAVNEAVIRENADVRFIVDIRAVTNPDDSQNPLTQIRYYTAGKKEISTIIAEDAEVVAGLNKNGGDLVRFAVEDSKVVAIQKIFVDGVLYKHEYETIASTPADSNVIKNKYNNDSEYFKVIYGTVDSIDIDDNNLNIVAQITDDNDEYDNSSFDTLSVSSTVFYDYDEEATKVDDRFATDISLGSLNVANNGTTIDAENASKIVIIKLNGKWLAAYIVD